MGKEFGVAAATTVTAIAGALVAGAVVDNTPPVNCNPEPTEDTDSCPVAEVVNNPATDGQPIWLVLRRVEQ